MRGFSISPEEREFIMENIKTAKRFDVRRLVFSALMGALAIVLSEVLKFGLPFMPPFISFDFSDAPAMLASLTMGPISGVSVCLVKNVWGCFTSSTGCVGELSNFILSAALVLPAGLMAHRTSKTSRAVAGALIGSAAMAAVSFPANYFIVYPIYAKVAMPMDAIVGMYKAILPSVENLPQCLLIFNVPFTFAKGLIASIFSVVLYKKLRPIFNSMYRQEST